MRRSRPMIWAARVGLVAVVAGTLASLSGPAQAATADLSFSQEGTFWRLQQRAPIVDVPCNPIPADRCGPVSSGPMQSPEVPEGTVAVGHNGGPVAAEGSDTYGDQYWAVFEVDLFSVDIETIGKLVLSLTRLPGARSDFGAPKVMACNIVTPFGVSEGTNPWADRPKIDCSAAKAGVVGATAYTFDVTDFASTWMSGTGYGVALVPGVPGSTQVVNDTSRTEDIAPFHVTFVGSAALGADGKPAGNRARAQLEFTPAEEESGFDDFGDLSFEDSGELGFGFGGDVEEFDSGDFSEGEELAIDTEEAAPEPAPARRVPFRPAGSDPGFPWIALLLLPLGAVAFWGTGTALGEAGDPLLPRQGGVSRILARRRAAGAIPTDSTPR